MRRNRWWDIGKRIEQWSSRMEQSGDRDILSALQGARGRGIGGRGSHCHPAAGARRLPASAHAEIEAVAWGKAWARQTNIRYVEGATRPIQRVCHGAERPIFLAALPTLPRWRLPSRAYQPHCTTARYYRDDRSVRLVQPTVSRCESTGRFRAGTCRRMQHQRGAE